MYHALSLMPVLQASKTNFHYYPELPLHVLLGAILFFIFRRAFFSLAIAFLGFWLWVLIVVAAVKFFQFLNYLLPLGLYWCVVLAAMIVFAVIAPAFYEIALVCYKTARYFYRLFTGKSLSTEKESRAYTDSSREQQSCNQQSESESEAEFQSASAFDPYKILGVQKDAPLSELRSAYLNKMKKQPPRQSCQFRSSTSSICH